MITAGARLVALTGLAGASITAGQRLYSIRQRGTTAGEMLVSRSALISATAGEHLLNDGNGNGGIFWLSQWARHHKELPDKEAIKEREKQEKTVEKLVEIVSRDPVEQKDESEELRLALKQIGFIYQEAHRRVFLEILAQIQAEQAAEKLARQLADQQAAEDAAIAAVLVALL